MQAFVDRHYRSLLLMIWLLSCMLLLTSFRTAIAEWRMGDPDDQLRIVQIRDWMNGQSWWDIKQYRMNLPDGGPMHWSRLVDVPIAAMILLLRPLTGQMMAEQWAAAIVPLLTLGVALFFLAAMARRLFGNMAAVLVSVLLLTIMPAISQLVPMRIDHHGWQLALFFAACWALFDHMRPVRGAIVIGCVLALWMEISIEGLPFAAVILGVLALRWLLPADGVKTIGEQWAFPVALSALASSTAIFFSITEHWPNTPNYCDSLSPVHVAIFAAMAAVVVVGTGLFLKFYQAVPLYAKIVIGALAGLSGLTVLLTTAPQCAGDAFSQLDLLVRQYWFNRTPEGLPLWSMPLDFSMPYIAGLTGGLLGLGYLQLFSNRLDRQDKLSLAILFFSCAVVGSSVSRTAVYAVCLGSIMLAPMIIDFFHKAEKLNGLTMRMALRVFAVALALPTLIGQNIIDRVDAAGNTAKPALAANDKAFENQALACQSLSSVAALNRIPSSQLMAGLDTSPSILQTTHHKVIATGHHRNQAAMADVIRTFIGTVGQAEAVFRGRKVDYLITCDGSVELRMYADSAPAGFMAQINHGNLPPWLKQQPDIGPFHIFKVDWPASAEFRNTR